ncbi:hypothetical protein TTHERM_000498179 (macronuclear) [Tetrahymena thermophila SB210]|uniref:Uncharacterized protein n=1 Tax=Tetrahymena thermophila (strain SB210) TaxID=312017 RepID=W7WZD6_TETTS|nr:hypothetical protein TTHERM_000498179 [Tetrahymena thermophila SB210]EWS70967.1 hypothetical protein TTHERM_000498179 [Tetrahymena thermophila SB210]|eukprot:XP_012656523.1 hypothetical protein TTHERM_000498179 [Tetrahymena thermophila SB210]
MSAELTNECTELFTQVQNNVDQAMNSFNSKIFDNLISEFSKLDKDMMNISNNLNKSVLEAEKSKNMAKETIDKLKLNVEVNKKY